MIDNFKHKLVNCIKLYTSPELVKNLSFYSIGVIVSALSSFILVPLYTRSFSPNEYGQLELLNSFFILIGNLGLFGLLQVISIEYYKYTDIERISLIKDTCQIILQVITPIFIILIIVAISFSQMLIKEISTAVLLTATTSVYLFTIFNIYLTYLQISKKAAKYSSLRSLSGVLILLLNYLFIYYFKLGIISYFLSNCIFYFIILIHIILEYHCKYKLSFEFIQYSKLKPYYLKGLPFIITTVIIFINTNVDKYIIKYFFSNYEVGIYSVAFRFSQSYEAFFISPIILAYSAHAYEKFSRADFYQNYRLIFILSFVLFTLFAILTPIVAYFIIGKDYLESLQYIPILVYGVWILFMVTIYNLIIAYHNEGKMLIKNVLITCIFYLLCNLLLIYYFKLWGAVFTYLLSNLVYLIFSYLSVDKIIKNKINK